ncbi:MAG: response regulator [Sulfurimonas sp.]|nr:response regulator [Sulfurimonas sp.]
MYNKKIAWTKSLSSTLLAWFLFVSIAPLIIYSLISYNATYSSLKNSAILDIEQSSLMKKKYINNWFSYRKTDISSWSQSKLTTSFLIELSNEYQDKNIKLSNFVTSYPYMKIVNKYENEILKISREYNYIYDVYLIDKEGNILYSIIKDEDLGTNLITGVHSKSKFASTVKKTLIDGEINYSDLEIYSIENKEISSFLTAPLVDDSGYIIGVYALKLKLDGLFSIFNEDKDIREGYIHYLVGEDSLLRNDINTKYQALKFKIDSKQFLLWHYEHTSEEKENIDEKEKIFIYKDSFGYEVIGLHQDISVLGVNWVLISEIKKELILYNAKKQSNMIILFFIFIILIVVILSIFISRRISKPINLLSKANIDFSNGERDVFLKTKDNGEIGILIKSFNRMVQSLKRNEEELIKQTNQAKNTLLELDEQKHALDAHSIVAITDIKGNITYVNNKFIDISGYSKEELIGKNHRIINSKTHNTEFWKEMYYTISRGKIWHNEVCNISKKKDYYWVDTTIVPFMGENNKPKSYIVIRTDITVSKQLEFDLIKANKIAQDTLKAKSEFLASMSHEIRTPMNGVIGMLGLLAESKLTDKQSHQLHLAQSNASSLLTLINDILDYSKVEAGKLKLEKIEFNFIEEIGDFVEAIAFKAQEKDVEIILDTSEVKYDFIISDPGRIRQILNNIVGNAIKFTSHGYVLIKVILDISDKDNTRVKFSVSDTGIGIAKDKIENLFDKFTQADASTTRKYGGTGLGLAIAKNLSKLMNGSIDVKSSIGVGTTFNIDIEAEIGTKASLIQPKVSIDKKKILLVDSSKTNQDVISKQLKIWKANVSIAYNTRIALKLCEDEISKKRIPPFDLIFIDMNLPKIDGCEFAKEIRKNTLYDKMKIVLMTCLNSNLDTEKLREIKISAYFPKPVTTNNLFYALKALNCDDLFYQEKLLIHQKEKKIVWGKNINILLVDDNETNQAVAQGMLNILGLDCDIVNNGQEALDMLKSSKQQYDIVFMDCQMPIMDGYKATRAIRKGKCGNENSSVIIVAMTANAMQGDKEKCITSGMDDYISKPIDMTKLKETLKKYLLKDVNVEYIDEESEGLKLDKQKDLSVISTAKFSIWDEKEALTRLGESHKILNKILEIFLIDIDKQINMLKNSIDLQNLQNCELYAHTIKGSAANISAKKLQNISSLLETAAKNSDIKKLKKEFILLENYAKEVVNILKEHLKIDMK